MTHPKKRISRATPSRRAKKSTKVPQLKGSKSQSAGKKAQQSDLDTSARSVPPSTGAATSTDLANSTRRRASHEAEDALLEAYREHSTDDPHTRQLLRMHLRAA
jgi:hypothetical protein